MVDLAPSARCGRRGWLESMKAVPPTLRRESRIEWVIPNPRAFARSEPCALVLDDVFDVTASLTQSHCDFVDHCRLAKVGPMILRRVEHRCDGRSGRLGATSHVSAELEFQACGRGVVADAFWRPQDQPTSCASRIVYW